MFRKPFIVKKNTNLRNSDIRKLLNRIKDSTSETIVVDKKSEVSHVKVESFLQDEINIYSFEKVPMFFDFSPIGNIYPTVFCLKTHKLAFPVIFVHEPVLSYLENGADLMLPGVVRLEGVEFPDLIRGAPVTIALYSRGKVTGPVAVGCTLKSTAEMVSCGFQGKGVQVLHVFRDFLWEFGPRGQPLTYSLEEFLSKEIDVAEKLDDLALEDKEQALPNKENVEEPHEEDEKEVVEEEDLLRCFIAGLKHRLKKSDLPMDVGQFYTQCLLKCVPEGKHLDMKKTKYKKFGVFLQDEATGKALVKVSNLAKSKGADVITEVYTSSTLYREFEVTNEKITDEVVVTDDGFIPPQITEYVSATGPVMPFLKMCDPSIQKKSLLSTTVTRELVTSYVKNNSLSDGKLVKMDPHLADASSIKTTTTDWNTLIQSIQAKMTKTWVIKWSDGREFVRKTDQPIIQFLIEKRASNKKVTLVNNLSVFGIQIKVISHQIQTGVAASVTSNPVAVLCEGPQLLVQGNQILFISDLLINTYGIDKKFIKGMELAPKKKN